MKKIFLLFILLIASNTHAADILPQDAEKCYNKWRDSMLQKNAQEWADVTAPARQAEVKNRIVSEKKAFPAAVFNAPLPPPSLANLKLLKIKTTPYSAVCYYFGPVDFKVVDNPGDNLLAIFFEIINDKLYYDRADYVSLAALGSVRKELKAGKLTYIEENPELQPSATPAVVPPLVRMAKYIAKVYVFCPERDITLLINKTSKHHFVNAKDAQIVIGGVNPGLNELQFFISDMGKANDPNAVNKSKEPMTIRVYLMSEKPGVKPIKVFEMQPPEGTVITRYGTKRFDVTSDIIKRL